MLRGGAAAGLVAVAAPGAGRVLAASSRAAGRRSATTVKTADVPVGGGVIEDATSVVVVQPTAGEFKAYSAVCPHQGCRSTAIADGEISARATAARSGSATASVVTGPATQGLTVLTSTVQGDEVVVTAESPGGRVPARS